MTEIASDTTCILIYLGQNLSDGKGEVNDTLANEDAISIFGMCFVIIGNQAIFYYIIAFALIKELFLEYN